MYMKNKVCSVGSISEALEYFQETMAAHSDRNALDATLAAMAGKRRKSPCFSLGYQNRPDDKTVGEDELVLPEVQMPDNPEGSLAREIIQLLNPLKLLNPVLPCLALGKGTGTLVPSFGIPLDPALGDQPSRTLTLDEILSMPEPITEEAGLAPEIRGKIKFIKENLQAGEGLYIAEPDMQGPFNIAHAIAGADILIGPFTEPEKYHKVMARVTQVWIQTLQSIRKWIGPEWQYPVQKQTVRIAECSVNLVSRETYEEFILPYDLEIARAFAQPLLIHTCSGAHVFHATLDNLPDILFTEAGFIKNAVRGWTPVDEALRAIGDRPIVLNIGQEIYNKDDAEAFIKRDFDRYMGNPRLLFGYTQMEWRNKDRARIREIHRKCDDYWAEKYGDVTHGQG
jgi:hypothetical protein